MTANAYEQLIVEGIKGLPTQALAEIADFISFLRMRASNPQSFEEELRAALLRVDLRQLSRDEQTHLEKEFDGYDQLHPRE